MTIFNELEKSHYYEITNPLMHQTYTVEGDPFRTLSGLRGSKNPFGDKQGHDRPLEDDADISKPPTKPATKPIGTKEHQKLVLKTKILKIDPKYKFTGNESLGILKIILDKVHKRQIRKEQEKKDKEIGDKLEKDKLDKVEIKPDGTVIMENKRKNLINKIREYYPSYKKGTDPITKKKQIIFSLTELQNKLHEAEELYNSLKKKVISTTPYYKITVLKLKNKLNYELSFDKRKSPEPAENNDYKTLLNVPTKIIDTWNILLNNMNRVIVQEKEFFKKKLAKDYLIKKLFGLKLAAERLDIKIENKETQDKKSNGDIRKQFNEIVELEKKDDLRKSAKYVTISYYWRNYFPEGTYKNTDKLLTAEDTNGARILWKTQAKKFKMEVIPFMKKYKNNLLSVVIHDYIKNWIKKDKTGAFIDGKLKPTTAMMKVIKKIRMAIIDNRRWFQYLFPKRERGDLEKRYETKSISTAEIEKDKEVLSDPIIKDTTISKDSQRHIKAITDPMALTKRLSPLFSFDSNNRNYVINSILSSVTYFKKRPEKIFGEWIYEKELSNKWIVVYRKIRTKELKVAFTGTEIGDFSLDGILQYEANFIGIGAGLFEGEEKLLSSLSDNVRNKLTNRDTRGITYFARRMYEFEQAMKKYPYYTTVSLIGHSLGATIAILISNLYRDRERRIGNKFKKLNVTAFATGSGLGSFIKRLNSETSKAKIDAMKKEKGDTDKKGNPIIWTKKTVPIKLYYVSGDPVTLLGASGQEYGVSLTKIKRQQYCGSGVHGHLNYLNKYFWSDEELKECSKPKKNNKGN